jgi:hypothetical protein
MAQKLKTVDEILESLDLVVEKHQKDENGFAVLVVDKNSDFKAWIDVDIYEDDIRHEWNQYIFHLINGKDVRQRDLQDNADLYMEYTDKAVEYLRSIGEIEVDENDNWKYLK